MKNLKYFLLITSLFTFTILPYLSYGQCTVELATPYNTDNGQRGAMFDITANNTLTITDFEVNMYLGTSNYEIYYKVGTHVGSENTAGDWTFIGAATGVTSLGVNIPTPLPIPVNVTIPAGQRYSFYITNTVGGGLNYTIGTAVGNVLSSNVDMTVYEGVGKSYPFNVTFSVRNINATINYISSTTTQEINVVGNGNNIVSGTGTTSLTNNTNFGDVVECGTNSISKTYTIQNTGGDPLLICDIALTGDADFTLSGLPTFPATIAGGGSQNFTVTFDPSATGNRTATINITNNDVNENSYTYAINGNGTADNINPIIPTLADVTAQCSVPSITAPTTTDNCSGTITGTTTQTFPITSSTTVIWTFDDGNGNSVTANQNVIIDDTTNPVVPTLANVTAQCSVPSITAPTTTDNCSGTITGTTATIFPITSSTTVVWTFTDGNGNSVTANQNVIIDDTTNPVVPTLANVTAQCSVPSITAPTTTDNCAGIITGTTATIFPITSSTTVTWTFDDGNGNSVTANQNVIIDDTTNPVVPTLANVTAQCSVPSITAPTTTDNCAGIITGTTATIFPITSSTTVTWTFDDGNGNSVTANQNVIIDDTTNPVVPTLANVTAQCSVPSITAPTTTDNCSGTITGTTTQTFPITSSTTVVWTFTDGNGNSVTANQNVIIDDTTNPVIPTLANVTAQCSVPSITAPTTTDNCAGIITGTTATIFPITSSTTVTWTFDDGNGNSVTANQNVIIDDTTNPVVPTLANVTAQCSVPSITAPTTTDNCAGIITGTTATIFPITSSTTVTWTFDDGNGNSVTANQNVIIDDTTNPVIPTLANVTAQCSVPSITAPTTTDNCAGIITGTTATIFPITSSTTVTWTFDDGNGNSVTANQNVIIDDTTNPVVPTLANVTAQCSVPSITAPTTTDNCAGIITGTTATIFPITSSTTVTWTFDDGNGNSVTANQNVIIDDTTNPVVPTLANVTAQCSVPSITAPTTTDNCSGTITGTTTQTFPITSSTTVVWTFTDGNGNSVTANQNVIIDDTTNPIVPTLTNVTAQCSVASLTAPTTTDNCSGTITGTTTQTFPITSSTTVVWTFTDGNGNSVTANQNVIIDDTTNPIVPTLTNVTAQCSVASLTAPTTTDNCSGTITGTTTQTFPITSSTTVVWTFTDGNGNSVTANQNVIIDDTTNPIVPTLTNVTAQCSVASITAPTTTDNCSGTITGTTTQTFPITAQGTTIVTWTFDDGNGNSVTANQNVVITDNTNPTITAPANVTANTDTGICTASGVVLGTPIGSDNCGTPTFTNNAPITFPIGNTTVTWTADDGNGNTATTTQTITITSPREINVLGNAISIVDGDATPSLTDNTDFGNTVARTITYTIQNTGTAALTITSIASSNAADFAITGIIPTSVAGGSSATFDVTFVPSGAGIRTATITLNNNDCDEAIYDFAIEGSNISSGDVLLVETGIYYPTIQQAVAAAVTGNTIQPTIAKNYPENVVVDKNLTFTSPSIPIFDNYQSININQIKVNPGIKLTIAGNMSIVEVLEMDTNVPDGNAEVEVVTGSDFALLSTASSTAMVVNRSANTVVGNVIGERYIPLASDVLTIDPTAITGYDPQGYHFFSSPFTAAPISQFADDMNLVMTPSFNTALEPTYTTPFPTFYVYDETSAGTPSPSGIYNEFTIGFKVPMTTNLEVGRGYDANISAGTTVDLNGTLNNGNITIPITHQGLSYAKQGFNLIGNPYPSPISWTQILANTNASSLLEDAIYVNIPTSQYGTTYASFVNNFSVNDGSEKIAAYQGFFVQAKAAGTLVLDNSIRSTVYEDPRFFRTDENGEEKGAKEGAIKLAIEQDGKIDETGIYFERGATSKFDGKFDALKINKINSTTPTLYSYNEGIEENGENTYFSINGLAEFNEDMILPLAMSIVKSGKHKIVVREIKYFHSLSNVYLYDSLTETLHDLKANPEYEFVALAGREVKRFVLLFKIDKNFTQKDHIVVYPNPTPNNFSYSLKNDREGIQTIRLYDAVGKLILERTETKEGAFLEGTINLEKHASGLYLLQISDSNQTTNVRIIKE